MKIKYIEIVRNLKWKIASGVYKQSEQLPSENQLAIKYACSRLTARKALQQLKTEKLIVTRKGKGYFVSLGTKKRYIKPKSGELGSKIQFHVINHKPSSTTIKNFLSLGLDINKEISKYEFQFLKTQYDYEDKPFTILHSFINTNIFSDVSVEKIKDSLSAYFIEKNVVIKKRIEKVLMHQPGPSIMVKLNLKKHQKVLTTYSLMFDKYNKVVEFAVRYTIPEEFVSTFTTFY